MLSTIKFRVWDTVREQYTQEYAGDACVYENGDLCIKIHNEAGTVSINAEDHPDRFIVEQKTGLVDADGVDIYEGDVINTRTYSKLSVVYAHGSFMCDSGTADRQDYLWDVMEGFQGNVRVVCTVHDKEFKEWQSKQK